MTTDSERREVAARLRKTRVERYNSILSGIPLGESVRVCAQIVSPHEDQVRAAADRLADLIEPVERMCLYYDSDTNHCGCYDTRLIDRDALLALADEMENNTWYETGFDHHIAVRFARRIREALGVEHG